MARALLLLVLVLLPVHARAQLGLDALDLEVFVGAENGQDVLFEVTISVTGTDIGTATLTRQGGSAIALPCSAGTTCSATQQLASQAALDALLPTSATSYTVELKQGADTLADTLSFARPAVPSPAISQPLAGSTIDPGSVEVEFAPCPTCDATQGFLVQGGSVIDEVELPPSSTSWTPPTALAPNGEFLVEIAHVLVDATDLVAEGSGSAGPSDDYRFTASVVHADQVEFATGFPSPLGEFCIVVNDTAPPSLDPTGSCTAIVEPGAGILDTTGSYATIAGGIAIEYTLQLAANGRLFGLAVADLDGDTSFETPAALVGRLRGSRGLLRQKPGMRFVAPGSGTRFTLRRVEQANLLALESAPDLVWLVEQTARGRAAGAKLAEKTTSLHTTQDAAGGWRLGFALSGADGPISGSLRLASGVSVTLTGQHVFDSALNQSHLAFHSEGADGGAWVRLKRVEIDTSQPPGDRIGAGVLRFRAFGQRGSALLH